MIIWVSSDGEDVQLHEPDDFMRLKLVTDADPAGAAALAGCRSTDDGHVFVPPEFLTAWAGDAAKQHGWREGFDGMLQYAARSGWVADDGAVRVHVDRETE